MKESSSFSKGERVESFNSNAIYLKEDLMINGKIGLKIYKFVNGLVTEEWTVENLGEIVNTFFDFKNNVFYVADFLSGSVIVQDLTKGSAPSSYENPLPSGNQTGKCGDGTCDGPETSANCPADCKSVAPKPSSPAQGKCGDGVCDGPETSANCSVDCK